MPWRNNIGLVLLLFLGLAACRKEAPFEPATIPKTTFVQVDPIPANLILIGTQKIWSSSLNLALYMEKQPIWGNNKLFIAVYDSATLQRITTGIITISALVQRKNEDNIYMPVMNAMTCNISDKLWKPEVILLSGLYQYVRLIIKYKDDTNKLDCTINMYLRPNGNPTLKGFSTNGMYYIQSDSVTDFKLGMNKVDFAVFLLYGKNSFIRTTDYNLSIRTDKINHSITPDEIKYNEVSLQPSISQHYSGKINIPLTGDWRVQLKLNSVPIVNYYCSFTLENK